MNKNGHKSSDYLKDLFVAVFFIALICIRHSTKEDVQWIGLITFLGFFIALFDLFYECMHVYKSHRKEKKMVFVFLLCIGYLCWQLIKLAEIFTGVVSLTSKQNDIYTLLALLVTLPHNLYVKLFGIVLFRKD